jgi:hypothetical protein
MSIVDWATTISGFLAVVVFIGATIRYLIKNYLSELKPDGNGGHNLEGRVARIEQRVDDIYKMLAER